MTMISDLPQDLVEEILARVAKTSLGAVRSTCKRWNALSKDRILCKTEPEQQFMGFMIMDFRLCSMKFNLHGILNEDGLEFVDPSIKEIGILLNIRVEISQVFHCNGLLLCVTRDNTRLVVWNPYLGQTKWINTKNTTSGTMYVLGCDNNKNHKILKYSDNQHPYEIYDLKSDSWRVVNVITNWELIDWYEQHIPSVNGNTYFWTKTRILVEGYDSDDEVEIPDCLICFDFTTERFGQFLSLPFQIHFVDTVILSCVKEEKLAALYQHRTSVIEIWITTKIEPNALSWTPFLKFDIEPLVGLDFQFDYYDGSFFIDEEKKVAVVIDVDESNRYKMAYIIGENGYLKKVSLGEKERFRDSLMCCSSYVPSLVQIDQIARQKKREKKRNWKTKRKEKKRMKKELTTTTTTRSKNTTSQKGYKKLTYYLLINSFFFLSMIAYLVISVHSFFLFFLFAMSYEKD